MKQPKTTQMMHRMHELGQAASRDFKGIVPSSSVAAYLRDRILGGYVVVVKTDDGMRYRLTERGRVFLGVSILPKEEPQPATAINLPQPEPTTETPLDAAIEALGRALVSRITLTVEQQISSAVDHMINQQIAASVHKVAAKLVTTHAGDPRPRVLVVGLLNDQGAMIRDEFGSDMDIRVFGSNNLNYSTLKANAASHDVVFIMADFISHSTIKAIESVGVKPIIVKGGMTTLRDAITEYYLGV